MLMKIKVFSNWNCRIQEKPKPKRIKEKKQKWYPYESLNALYEGREMVLNGSKSVIFPLPPLESTDSPTEGKNVLHT